MSSVSTLFVLLSITALVFAQNSTFGTLDLTGVVPRTQTCRLVFNTSFESPNFGDFGDFYVTPLNDTSVASKHGISTEKARTGSSSHRGEFNAYSYYPHRGFPSIQYFKQQLGSIKNKLYSEVWVYLEPVTLPDTPWEWLMFASFATDSNYSRYISVNIDRNNMVHLMHVPYQEAKSWSYQDLNATMPFKQWVNITTYVDFTENNGKAVVWMNGKVVSIADIKGTNGQIADSHFGLYASGNITSGIIYNDDIAVYEVATLSSLCPSVPGSPNTTAFIDTTQAPLTTSAPKSSASTPYYTLFIATILIVMTLLM